ncbi:hypothetical protein GCK32_000837, partial [Trichostrongylus colubriformis]
MNAFAKTQGVKLDQTTLANDAADIVNFDHLLAMTYSTDDTTRRQFDRSYNPMTINQLLQTYPKISWHTFTSEAVGSAQHVLQKLFSDPTYNYIVMEPAKLQALHDMLGNETIVSARTLVNYAYYHVVDSLADFLPPNTATEESRSLRRLRIQRPPAGKRRIRAEEKRFLRKHYDDISQAQSDCAMETVFMLPFANGRVFIDKIYPTSESRTQMREHVAKVASSILIGFRSMLDQLNWMTPATKNGAYNKIDNLVKNIGYPDWIANDTQFTSYH